MRRATRGVRREALGVKRKCGIALLAVLISIPVLAAEPPAPAPEQPSQSYVIVPEKVWEHVVEMLQLQHETILKLREALKKKTCDKEPT